MIKKTLITMALAAAAAGAVHAQVFYDSQISYLRTDTTTDFGGAVPTSINGGVRISELRVEPSTGAAFDPNGANSAGINLTGNDFDSVFTFRFFDADGTFSFTENFDDKARVDVTPISGPLGSPTGAAGPTHSDTGWDTRTQADYAFGAGGWFAAEVHLYEDGGGAGAASGLGFGYFNGASTSTNANYAGIGYGAQFDTDPATGKSWGTVPDGGSSAALLGMALLSLAGVAKRFCKS